MKLSELTINPTSSSVFYLPPRRCTQIFLFLEIISAEDFEYDNLHVRYCVRLPERCEFVVDTDGTINEPHVGSTHSVKKSQDGQWKFGFCYELCILCSEDYKFEG